MISKVAKHKNNANEPVKYKSNANEAAKQENIVK